MAAITDPAHARRLARAIASDIGLYNEAAIDQAIAEDNLFDALGERFAEGLALYRSRVDASCDVSASQFWHAIIDIVIATRAHIRSPMW